MLQPALPYCEVSWQLLAFKHKVCAGIDTCLRGEGFSHMRDDVFLADGDRHRPPGERAHQDLKGLLVWTCLPAFAFAVLGFTLSFRGGRGIVMWARLRVSWRKQLP